ncbi:hypothetical protein AYO22_08628 [Fonsecaea multimorphosa]|nr:hypothetical protein AYO22_08628 [Fonsecaea multimorphosa]
MAALVDGGMIEAKRRRAVIDDTDEDTFIRVIEFAYTGDYAVAEPDFVPPQPNDVENPSNHLSHEPSSPPPAEPYPVDEPAPAEPVEDDGWGPFSGNALSYPKKGRKLEDAWGESRGFKAEQSWDAFKIKAHTVPKVSWEPEVNEDPRQDYTPVFLCHARLYVFSDKYFIEPLEELVLQKLRLTLSSFKLHPQRVGDVVELLNYTYENTPAYDGKIDKLRNLVSDYLVCHIEKIVHNAEFINLLGNSDLVKDFLPKLVERRLD